MRVYIAAPWAERELAKQVAERLIAKKHIITHDWWNYDPGKLGVAEDEEFLRKCARDDMDAVHDCEVFLLLNTQERGQETSGKAVELGLALGMYARYGESFIRILGVGIRGTNIFQVLPEVEWFDSIDAAVEAI
jgi:hypothetical protein